MKKYDILIAGGGFAGIGAALAAARLGKSVLIVDRNGALGGAASDALVFPFMPYATKVKKPDGSTGDLYLVRGVFKEITDAVIADKSGDTRSFNTARLTAILDTLVKEAGVDVLFHAELTGVKRDAKRINTVSVATVGGTLELQAAYFIDATGDANLAFLANCRYRLGRESDSLCQPMTLCFRVSGVNYKEMRKHNTEIQRLYCAEKEKSNIKNPREDILYFPTDDPNVVHFNTTRVIKHNPTDPFMLSAAEMEARRQMVELVDFLRNTVPECQNAVIVSAASRIGVRESRMVEGEHRLTAMELMAFKKFPDAVAAGNYDIDIHNPEGSGTSHYFFPMGEYYTIPLGSLIVKEADNLLVAGRCISCDHEAQASIRIMPICCATGHAAGVAASVACETMTPVKSVDVQKVQEQIKEQNGFF